MTPNWLELSAAQLKIVTKAHGPGEAKQRLPLTDELLRHAPSGDLFGLSQNAGMGWEIGQVCDPPVLIFSTLGGGRNEDGTPYALGLHTGHYELGLLVKAAATELRQRRFIPFATFCSDCCDGRTNGTPGMIDSLPSRNTTAEAFGFQIRSLPGRAAIMGVATCDKGLPAAMMALAAHKFLPGILVPGGVTTPVIAVPGTGYGENTGSVQSIGARFATDEITLEHASEGGCTACASPGGGCQFLGTAATSQVVAEALGICLPHSALAPSGQEIWLKLAVDSATALDGLIKAKIRLADILTDDAIYNAIVVHAAFGGSTNLLLHVAAIARSAGLRCPTVDDWTRINQQVSRLVDVLPNGPKNHPTLQVYLAGGVPEVMLHLRDAGLLRLDVMTVTGKTLGENLAEWETSQRRDLLRALLEKEDGIDPNNVIMSPDKAKTAGLTPTLVFPTGNLAPEGSVVKATAIDPTMCKDGVYNHTGRARVFVTENAAIAAIKSNGPDQIKPGEVIVLCCRGPLASGMPETFQITNALKMVKRVKGAALLTDGRFSGVSTGACVGHIGPEAMAGGPIGKLLDGDLIEIRIDRNTLVGSINFVGSSATKEGSHSAQLGAEILAERSMRTDLCYDPDLPPWVKLWGAMQNASGGTWGGSVFDVDALVEKLNS